ncbi:glycosyltransferase [Peribacillus sp. NPDC094092]|uniref:glycosyltransferase n=1 Tax=Peribacillus sp. NPDC094092 TaxID=3390611 RepID=UPI003D08C6AF
MQHYNQPPVILNRNNITIVGILRTYSQSKETLFVKCLYREFLYREPDQAGFQGFVNFLMAGESRFSVLIAILTSEESISILGSSSPTWKKHFENIVSCIIPSFNQVALVKQCLKSLKATTTQISYEIIDVDDGSKPQIQRQLFDWGEEENVEIILKKSNEGFSCTVNQGIKQAKGKYVLLINNDIIFSEPEWLGKMIHTMQSSSEIGVVGARLLYPDQTIQHGGMSSDFFHRYVGLPAEYSPALVVEEVQAVTGALFLIYQDVIADLGHFSEDYFTAYEDVEFCLRARLKGWKVIYCGQAAAIHLEGKTRGGHQKNPFYMQKNFEAFKKFEMKWSGYYNILKS